MAAITLSSPSGSKSSRVTVGCPDGPTGGVLGRRHQIGEELLDQLPGLLPGALEVGRPRAAPVGPVHPGQEGRDDLAQLLEHQVGVAPGLGQRVGPHPHEQHLVGLAGPVDAHVGERGRRQQAAQGVEGLGLDRLAVDEVGVAGLAGVPHGQPRLGLHQQLAVGVEHPVHVPHVPGPEGRVEQPGVAVVPVVAGGQPVVVGDVPGGLLEVGHQPAPLQHLGQDVGGLLAGQVDPAQLGHRVVAVLEEDLLVELLGPLAGRRWRPPWRRR